jgi:hypothetical protein
MATLGGLTAYPLLVQARVTRTVRLHEHQGAAIRGAFFGTLRARFCVRQELTSCQPCTLHAVCPISALVATVDDASPRGLDVPRPFTLEPPVRGPREYYPGQVYRFGLTLFGRGLQLLPYALVGLQDVGTAGIGWRGPEGTAGAGQLHLERVEAWNPITGRRQAVYAAGTGGAGEGTASRGSTGRHGPIRGNAGPAAIEPELESRGRAGGSNVRRAGAGAGGAGGQNASGGGSSVGGIVHLPSIKVTHGDVLLRAGRWLGRDRLRLRLLTPLRLVSNHQPVRRLSFELFLRRLVDRLELLARHYGLPEHSPPAPLGAERVAALGAAAAEVRVVDDRTRWVEVFSRSARQGRRMPVSGLVGEITFEAAPERLAAFLPWLVWGELAHAGKDATKGNGWYVLLEP